MLKLVSAVILVSSLSLAIPNPNERPWLRKIKHSVEADKPEKAAMDAFFETTKELLNLHLNCEQSGGVGFIEGVKESACSRESNRWLCAHQGSVVCLTSFETGLSPQKRTEGLIGFASGDRWIGVRTPNSEYDFGPLKQRYLEVYGIK